MNWWPAITLLPLAMAAIIPNPIALFFLIPGRFIYLFKTGFRHGSAILRSAH